MNANVNTEKTFEDLKVNVKIKLSALWVTLMFFYLYRDVLGYLEPGHIEKIIAGEIAGIKLTHAVLLGSAFLMAIPSFMVFLSLLLRAKVNRWVNVILSVAHLGLLVSTLFVGEVSTLYIFYVIVEAALLGLILWFAWKWPKHASVKAT